MTVTVEFFVEGRPQTAGSKSAIPIRDSTGNITGSRVVESGDRGRKGLWRDDIRAAARDALVPGWSMDGPFSVEFVFLRRRPKGHYGSGRNALILKATAPEHPTTRPDALKLARAVEDALTGIAWHDDAAIVDERLRKVFGEREGVAVTLRVIAQAAETLAMVA